MEGDGPKRERRGGRWAPSCSGARFRTGAASGGRGRARRLAGGAARGCRGQTRGRARSSGGAVHGRGARGGVDAFFFSPERNVHVYGVCERA